MPVTATVSTLAPKLALSEIMSFAFETFCANKVRFLLTGLGMVIGTVSLILVVTIGLTGKQYVLNLIQGIGANLIYAEYEGGAQRITNTAPDTLTIEDMQAAQAGIPGIVSASPVLDLNERVPVGAARATCRFWACIECRTVETWSTALFRCPG
jgi:putative ABC transport system permease protein